MSMTWHTKSVAALGQRSTTASRALELPSRNNLVKAMVFPALAMGKTSDMPTEAILTDRAAVVTAKAAVVMAIAAVVMARAAVVMVRAAAVMARAEVVLVRAKVVTAKIVVAMDKRAKAKSLLPMASPGEVMESLTRSQFSSSFPVMNCPPIEIKAFNFILAKHWLAAASLMQ